MSDQIRNEERTLRELGQRLELLRTAYEQYFMGLEKREPFRDRKAFESELRLQPELEKSRRSVVRYRYSSLIQRYNSFSRYWDRVLREIEEGTYIRDRLKVKRRFGVDVDPVARLAKKRAGRAHGETDSVDEIAASQDEPVSDVGRAAQEMLDRLFPGRTKSTRTKLSTVAAATGVPTPLEDESATSNDTKSGQARPTVQEIARTGRPLPPPLPNVSERGTPERRQGPPPSPPPLPSATPHDAVRSPTSSPGSNNGDAPRRMPTDPSLRAAPPAGHRVPTPIPSAKPPAPPAGHRVPTPIPSAKPPAPPAGNRVPTPVPSAKPASGEFRELFDHYTKAKSVHERATQNISYEDFERKMKRQKELHREKYQAKDVEYRVVVKDDKVSLVAKPKR